jgi:hypothetical protein
MRASIGMALSLAACTHVETAASPVAVSLPPARPAPQCIMPASAPTTGELCRSPHGDRRDHFNQRGLEDVLFDACDRFEPRFEEMVRLSCADAFTVHHDDGEPRDANGVMPGATRDARDRVFGKAALPLLPARCKGHFGNVAEDDWGRGVWELDSEWQSCAPDREVLDAYIIDYGDSMSFPIADVPVGAWIYATALADRMTPLGKQYLRKFVVCELLENASAHAEADDRKRLRKYLVSAPDVK